MVLSIKNLDIYQKLDICLFPKKSHSRRIFRVFATIGLKRQETLNIYDAYNEQSQFKPIDAHDGRDLNLDKTTIKTDVEG